MAARWAPWHSHTRLVGCNHRNSHRSQEERSRNALREEAATLAGGRNQLPPSTAAAICDTLQFHALLIAAPAVPAVPAVLQDQYKTPFQPVMPGSVMVPYM